MGHAERSAKGTWQCRRAAIALAIAVATYAVGGAWPRGTDIGAETVAGLVDAAMAAEAEHGAHLLLALVESGRVKDRDRRRALVDAALARISEAEDPYAVRLVAGYATDSREGYRAGASDMVPVDRLSLRCRAVRCLLDLDPRAARAELERVAPDLELPEVDCGAVLLPKPDVFYETVARVAARAFTADEREAGLDAALVERYVAGMRSGIQVLPVARLVAAVDLDGHRRAALVGAYAAALANVVPSGRLLDETIGAPRAAETFALLVDAARTVPGLEARLVHALRDYAVRSLGAARCPDSESAARVPASVTRLNGELFAARPITEEDVEVPRLDRAGEAHRYWSRARAAEALDAFQRLRAAREAMSAGKGETTEVGWKLEFDRLVDRLRAWRAEDEASDEDFVSQRCILYAGLYRVAPDEVTRRSVTGEFLTFLKHHELDGRRRALWVMFASYYAGQLPGRERAAVLDAFASSGNPTLAAYAALQAAGIDVLGLPSANSVERPTADGPR
jgi:hypothetical protein